MPWAAMEAAIEPTSVGLVVRFKRRAGSLPTARPGLQLSRRRDFGARFEQAGDAGELEHREDRFGGSHDAQRTVRGL